LAKWVGLDKAFSELRKECEAVSRGLTVSVWKTVLRETPQYSGNMAASWTYSIGTPQASNRPYIRATQGGGWGDQSFQPFKKGDLPAIAKSNDASEGMEMRFRLGQKVYITNGAPHAEDVTTGFVDLRAVNWPGRPVDLAMSRVESKYATGITKAAAAQLKALRI